MVPGRRGATRAISEYDVLRSQAFRFSMRLHGIPTAHIDKGRAEKRRFIRCGGRGMEPLRHTVLRYCDVFRRLGFVFDDPAPAEPRTLENPFGEKQGRWVGFAPFSAHRARPTPKRRAVNWSGCLRHVSTGSSSTAAAGPSGPLPRRWNGRIPM